MAVALLGAHTPSKNPRSISGMQAYITYSILMIFGSSALLGLENDIRNVCRNAWKTVVL
jgi:hypothetical protein